MSSHLFEENWNERVIRVVYKNGNWLATQDVQILKESQIKNLILTFFNQRTLKAL